jgi:SAM-dependent methyltransferase
MTIEDEREWWNEVWAREEGVSSAADEVLVSEIGSLSPGRVLEIASGSGANAVWLAQQGWFVTAVDFSETAIKRARRLAVERGVNVDFMVADATTYQPPRKYDLVVSFYIQLFPEQRAKMLANAVDALVPGGTLLFVSHDRSGPPPDWEEEFITTLTTPEEVVAELPGLEIQKAFVFGHGPGGPHGAHPRDATEHGHGRGHTAAGNHEPHNWLTTVVRATSLSS